MIKITCFNRHNAYCIHTACTDTCIPLFHDECEWIIAPRLEPHGTHEQQATQVVWTHLHGQLQARGWYVHGLFSVRWWVNLWYQRDDVDCMNLGVEQHAPPWDQALPTGRIPAKTQLQCQWNGIGMNGIAVRSHGDYDAVYWNWKFSFSSLERKAFFWQFFRSSVVDRC